MDDIETNLHYTRKRVNKVLEEIYKHAKKSNLFIIDPDYKWNFADSDDKRIIHITNILITPKKRLSNKLNKVLANNGEEDIKYHWTREYNVKDGKNNYSDDWKLSIWGREFCDDLDEVIRNETYDYGECPCPKEFKEYCQKTNAILRKYSSSP